MSPHVPAGPSAPAVSPSAGPNMVPRALLPSAALRELALGRVIAAEEDLVRWAARYRALRLERAFARLIRRDHVLGASTRALLAAVLNTPAGRSWREALSPDLARAGWRIVSDPADSETAVGAIAAHRTALAGVGVRIVRAA